MKRVRLLHPCRETLEEAPLRSLGQEEMKPHDVAVGGARWSRGPVACTFGAARGDPAVCMRFRDGADLFIHEPKSVLWHHLVLGPWVMPVRGDR